MAEQFLAPLREYIAVEIAKETAKENKSDDDKRRKGLVSLSKSLDTMRRHALLDSVFDGMEEKVGRNKATIVGQLLRCRPEDEAEIDMGVFRKKMDDWFDETYQGMTNAVASKIDELRAQKQAGNLR